MKVYEYFILSTWSSFKPKLTSSVWSPRPSDFFPCIFFKLIKSFFSLWYWITSFRSRQVNNDNWSAWEIHQATQCYVSQQLIIQYRARCLLCTLLSRLRVHATDNVYVIMCKFISMKVQWEKKLLWDYMSQDLKIFQTQWIISELFNLSSKLSNECCWLAVM